MTNPETAACRTTQHCAFHGWCRRCDPGFAAVMSRVNVAIQRTDADDTHWGPLYAAVAEALRPAAVSVPPPAPQADDRGALRDRIRRAVCEAEGFMWNTELLEPDEYGEVADAVLAVLPESAPRADAEPDDGEGDELVCVDECGFCNACGYEPFGTPAEGWREAARFLRRTARDSGDRQGALHGARLIEAELRRIAEEAVDDPQPGGPCVAGEQQNETPRRSRTARFLDALTHSGPGYDLTPTETPEAGPVHAIPLPGSNGISSCCGRPPCEFVGERVTRDPDKVTCTGPAAGVRQDGAQQ